jgi:Fe(3+) dicitrate transport protein
MILSSGSFPRKYALLLALGIASPARPAAADEPGKEPEPKGAYEPAELESVVILGKLVETSAPAPSTSTALTEEELEKFEDDDVHQILLRVPGVQVRGEDGVGLRPNIGIRGTNPNRSSKVTLMEDGLLLGPAPYSAPAAYYFPQVTRMTSVEVVKGGAQQRFGPSALGGAINLVTAEVPVGLLTTADVAVGQYNYLKAHGRAGYGTERTGFLLEAIHLQTDGFKDLDTGRNTGFDKNEVMAKWRIQSRAAADVFQRFDLKLGLSTERSDESYLGLTDADFAKTPYRRYAASDLDQMKWHRGQVEAVYSILPSDSLEIRVSAYRHQFARDWFKVDSLGGASLDQVLQNPDSPINRTYYEILTGQASSGGPDENLLMADNYRWYVSQGVQGELFGFASTGPLEHEIEAGVRLHYDEANRLHTQHEYAMVGAESNSIGRLERTGTPALTTAQNRGQAHALALHLVDTIEFQNLTLTPGLRSEFVFSRYTDELDPQSENRSTQVAFLPGMGAHYALFPEFGILAGGYRGFGPTAPQAKLAGEPLPRAERSTTWEGGARYATAETHLEAVGYFVDYGNLTANCSQAGGCETALLDRQFEGGKARVWGLEALAAHELTAGAFVFPLRATYTLTMSAFRTAFSSANPEWGNVRVGDELPYLPRHQATFAAGALQEEKWSVDATTTFVSKSREVAGFGEFEDNASTDAYALLGLAGKVRAFQKLWIYAQGSNMLDSAYLVSRRPHGARPGAPRWIHLGLKLEH